MKKKSFGIREVPKLEIYMQEKRVFFCGSRRGGGYGVNIGFDLNRGDSLFSNFQD